MLSDTSVNTATCGRIVRLTSTRSSIWQSMTSSTAKPIRRMSVSESRIGSRMTLPGSRFSEAAATAMISTSASSTPPIGAAACHDHPSAATMAPGSSTPRSQYTMPIMPLPTPFAARV
jgi:hypothetical protein